MYLAYKLPEGTSGFTISRNNDNNKEYLIYHDKEEDNYFTKVKELIHKNNKVICTIINDFIEYSTNNDIDYSELNKIIENKEIELFYGEYKKYEETSGVLVIVKMYL